MTETQRSQIPSSLIAGKHIVVAGAGISGLSFALSIHKLWPEDAELELPRITIIERDSEKRRLGREGYTLYIRSDGDRGGGVQVLDDLGWYETARDIAVLVSGESSPKDLAYVENADKEREGALVLWDKDWTSLIRVDPSKSRSKSKSKLLGMRVRRNNLQRLLVDRAEALPRVQIRWDSEVIDVEHVVGDGMLGVILSTESQVHCDWVIAADGSKSKIRKALRPSDGLDFRGLVAITGTARFESREKVPDPFAKEWGVFMGWTGIGLFLTPFDETAVTWSLTYRSAKPREVPSRPFSDSIVKSLLEEASRLGSFAGPKLQTLISATNSDTLMIFNLYDRPPFRHNLHGDGNVIWIGDANHVVTQFAGNGANVAMIDSWDLASELIDGGHCNLEEAVKAWEKTMIPRAKGVLSDSHGTIEFGHAVGWRALLYWSIVKVRTLLRHSFL